MMDTIDNLETRERPAEVGGGPEHAPLLAPRRRGWRGLTIFGIVALTILVAVAALVNPPSASGLAMASCFSLAPSRHRASWYSSLRWSPLY